MPAPYPPHPDPAHSAASAGAGGEGQEGSEQGMVGACLHPDGGSEAPFWTGSEQSGCNCVFGCRVVRAGGALDAGPRLSPHGLPGMQRQSVHCTERQAGPVDERHCDPLDRPDDRQRKCSEEPCPAR